MPTTQNLKVFERHGYYYGLHKRRKKKKVEKEEVY